MKKPVGILTYVSPVRSANPPFAWQKILAKHNLVWISAKNSGNTHPYQRRVFYTLLGLMALEREFDVRRTNGRTYISGFSGGSVTTGHALTTFPNIYDGAIYISGASWQQPHEGDAREAMRDKPMVFITGGKDFGAAGPRRIYRAYKEAGFERLLMIDRPSISHALPNAAIIERAIEFLDAELKHGVEKSQQDDARAGAQ